jgi:hypothetical protein
VRNRFFPTARFVQRCPRLLPASEAVVTVRRRPYGQNREGLPTGPTSPATNPDAAMPFIVRLLAPPAMAHDGLITADGTPSRQQLQGERRHPDSGLFSSSGSAIKRIKAGVKARPLNARQGSIWMRDFTLRQNSARTKKEYLLRTARARAWPRSVQRPLPGEYARTKPPKSKIGRYTYPLCLTSKSFDAARLTLYCLK